jgi:hypothetical protein
MPHRKMNAIQVDDAVVLQEPTLAPGFILRGQRLVEDFIGAPSASTRAYSSEVAGQSL